MEVLWKSTVSAEFLANRLKNHLSAKFSHQEISCNNDILGSGDIHIRMNILDKKWKSYIQTECSTSGKMYGLIKTHKNDNPARIITSGCNTAIESLSIFVEKVLYDIASNLPSRIKDTGHMLDIIDEINNSGLPTNSIRVGFDIVNVFPSIDNKSGLKSIHDILELSDSTFTPTSCVIETLELCLSCNNSIFNNTNYLQTDGTAQGPHMSCSYADLALAFYESKSLAFDLSPTT